MAQAFAYQLIVDGKRTDMVHFGRYDWRAPDIALAALNEATGSTYTLAAMRAQNCREGTHYVLSNLLGIILFERRWSVRFKNSKGNWIESHRTNGFETAARKADETFRDQCRHAQVNDLSKPDEPVAFLAGVCVEKVIARAKGSKFEYVALGRVLDAAGTTKGSLKFEEVIRTSARRYKYVHYCWFGPMTNQRSIGDFGSCIEIEA